jgi:hypothetical protein
MRLFKINTFICFTLLLLCHTASVHAQTKLPVIRAGSKIVDVIDGEDVRKGTWYIIPENKPDLYYVSTPHRPHRVVFRTDKDSIAFDTRYGGSYDFIIVLDNGDSCHTRILAQADKSLGLSSKRKTSTQHSDTIPMTIGSNDKIYISASINGSAPLNFQFDLGAGASILKKGSVAKVKMSFDGMATLINSDGRTEVPTSSKNTLVAGRMTWNQNIKFVVGDNLDRGEDGLLGNTLFLDKVIELNYDRKIMVIHDTLPATAAGYVKQRVILEGGIIPFVKASIKVEQKVFSDWYMFDTGYAGNLRMPSNLYDKHNLDGKVDKALSLSGTRIVLPGFVLAEQNFTNVQGILRKAEGEGRDKGQIGNSLLKRFNVFLDNQNGFIYLKPNSLMSSPKRGATLLMPWLIAVLLLVVALFFWINRRRKNRRL